MIRQPIFALLSAFLLVVLLWFVFDRVNFLRTAERTTGTVVSVEASNSRCGGRRNKYNCTRFRAHVRFSAGGGSHGLDISAGDKRGHNRPRSLASPGEGDSVNVVYNPQKPQEAYEDSIGGVWGTPLMVLMFQIGSFFTSLTEPRRRSGV